MKLIPLFAFTCIIFVHYIVAPPVKEQAPPPESADEQLEYGRYLKEVIEMLQTDEKFRSHLDNANEEDVKSGKIAESLDMVDHNIRTKLDEIKRRELERLRHLATKEYELMNEIDGNLSKVGKLKTSHLDKENPHTFEINDLKKLIKQTMSDMEEYDKRRKDEFKDYEMEKEFDKHQKMDKMDEQHKKEYEQQLIDEQKKQKNHAPLHHPGTRQQLEEVWEKQDHMENQEFDPKIFFMMHDVDGNGVWDADEVKALFIKELDKMYTNAQGKVMNPRERHEEMERMREHVFHEADHNRDGLIDYNEFLMQTRRAEFEKDPGWKGLDDQQIYTPEEYQEFEKRRLEELKYMQEHGIHPSQQGHPAYQPQYYPEYQGQPGYPQHPNQQQQLHPQQVQQINQQYQHYQNQMQQAQQPQYQQVPQPQYQQVPQQQMPQHQVPQQHVPQQQVPQQQVPQQQIPQQQIPQQHVPQQQMPQQQVPQQQVPQQQVPQQQVPQQQVPQLQVPQQQVPQQQQQVQPQQVPQQHVPQQQVLQHQVPQQQVPQQAPPQKQ